jgi:hypothetical protein
VVVAAAVLDSLAPGARLDEPAASIAKKLNLPFQPYVGYEDSSYRTPAGVRGIMLWVNDDSNRVIDRPSQYARIARIALWFASTQALESAKELLTRNLGTPERYCFGLRDKLPESDVYFWGGRMSRGVVLMVPVQPTPQVRPFLTFGATAPELNPSFVGAPRGKCAAA